jgi:hypothetical protein
MSAWEAVGAIAESVSALGIGILVIQVNEARKSRGLSEVVAYNDTKAHLDARAPRIEVHVEPPVWPPLGASQGVPQPYPGGTEWHFPQGQDHGLLLQAAVTVTNRSEATVRVTFEGDLWESLAPQGRTSPMRSEMLLSPGERVETLLRGGLSVKEWSEIDARVRAGERVDPVVTATITAHDDADNGVVDEWKPYLTGTPIAEDPARGSVWRLTPPPPFGGEHGEWCQSYDIQPVRRRTYYVSRAGVRELAPPRNN